MRPVGGGAMIVKTGDDYTGIANNPYCPQRLYCYYYNEPL